MKRAFLLLSVLLILSSLYACTETTSLQPPTNELSGNWIGTYEAQQEDKVPVDQTPVSATATFQVTNHSLVGLVYFTVHLPNHSIISPEPTQFIGTLDNHQVSMHRPASALCDPIRRDYVLYLDGVVHGDTLTMVGQDTICPVQEWIYLRSLKLIRQ